MDYLAPQNLYGVIGWPLAQTLSPLIHNTGFRVLDLAAVYMAWPVQPDQLDIFLRGMRVYRVKGCSVTIPHKEAVMPWLDGVSEGASLAGAANTLFWRDDALWGENTDIAGFLAPLANVALDHLDTLLLGAGGAARAVAAALRLRGCASVRVASPGNRRQYPLAERFGFTPISWEERYERPASLIINATPLGMHGENVAKTAYDFNRDPHPEGGVAYDLVYNPLETVFLRDAARAGRRVISGLEMFFGQGDAQFQLWTGRHLPRESLRALRMALAA